MPILFHTKIFTLSLHDALPISIGCSVGIAVYPQAGRDADVLLKNADMAMYQAKQRAESGFRFFTEAMNQQVHRQLRMKRICARRSNTINSPWPTNRASTFTAVA